MSGSTARPSSCQSGEARLSAAACPPGKFTTFFGSLHSSIRRFTNSFCRCCFVCSHRSRKKDVTVPASPSTISFVACSDSHSMHATLGSDLFSPADVFIHTGDLTQHGTKEELQSAISWLASLPYKHKVVIAGNHDISLDKDCTYRSAMARRAGSYATPEEADVLIASMREHNITYLSPAQPSTQLSVGDCTLSLYGLPFSPLSIGPSAFMRSSSENTWAGPQSSFDILLSHSPPRGHLDQNRQGDHIGCDHFLSAIERLRPSVAVFGHVHEARGFEELTWEDGTKTTLYNTAMMNKDRTLSTPTVFTLRCEKGSLALGT
jgi:predicted phosphodiesterase